MKFGYARISTKDQNIDMQIDALLRAGVEEDNIYTDVSSGAKRQRESFDKMCMKLRKGDVVIAWKLDRIARSTKHISMLMDGWEKEGIEFRSVQEPFFDTTTSHGRFVFTMFSAIAQLERDIIVERTNAGLRAAAKRGRKGGRPHGISKAGKKKAKLIAKLYQANNMTVEDIMESMNIGSKATFYKYLRFEGIEPDGVTPTVKDKTI